MHDNDYTPGMLVQQGSINIVYLFVMLLMKDALIYRSVSTVVLVVC